MPTAKPICHFQMRHVLMQSQLDRGVRATTTQAPNYCPTRDKTSPSLLKCILDLSFHFQIFVCLESYVKRFELGRPLTRAEQCIRQYVSLSHTSLFCSSNIYIYIYMYFLFSKFMRLVFSWCLCLLPVCILFSLTNKIWDYF